LIDVISEGIALGDIPDYIDPELGALALLGPIIYRRLMSGTPFEPELTPDLVETVLGPPGSSTHSQRGGSFGCLSVARFDISFGYPTVKRSQRCPDPLRLVRVVCGPIWP
jgi:hypothetical protein